MDICISLLQKIYEDNDSWRMLWDKYYSQWNEKSKTMRRSTSSHSVRNERLSLLITYGDSLLNIEEGEKPLETLYRFLEEMCDNVISGVHILPYSPFTSDDGFSISDYRKIREDLGDWSHIEKIASEYYLMSDLVLNHCSSKHEWFKKFLDNEEPYNNYFVTGDPTKDYSAVVRPRPHFILSEYKTKKDTQHVWTTFSRDQVDLNFANPSVLFEMLDILIEYIIDHKSRLIRLDAIAYLWKELGTPCIHHEKTHLVVKLMRALLELLAPDTIIITESNVPHKENISYFGNNDEAQMVYQFPLPPLLLYSMLTKTSKHLQQWASSIPQPSVSTSYFNFCASHDGIGITPTHGILSDEQREFMVKKVKQQGGLVSYKATPRGKIPYELNINYLSAVAPKELPNYERAKIFLASQSVLLSMPGVPGVYIHSLIGSDNWNHGVKKTGNNRTINRQQLDYTKIVEKLATKGTLRNEVFNGYLSLLNARTKSVAFHPAAPVEVLNVEDGLFALIRGDRTQEEIVLCIVNLTSKEILQRFDVTLLPWLCGGEDLIESDLVFLSQEKSSTGNNIMVLTVNPYEIMWLRFMV